MAPSAFLHLHFIVSPIYLCYNLITCVNMIGTDISERDTRQDTPGDIGSEYVCNNFRVLRDMRKRST